MNFILFLKNPWNESFKFKCNTPIMLESNMVLHCCCPTPGSRLMIGSCFINRQIMGSNMPTEWHCDSLERNDILFIRNEKKLLYDIVWTPPAVHRRTMQVPHNAPHSHPHNWWGGVLRSSLNHLVLFHMCHIFPNYSCPIPWLIKGYVQFAQLLTQHAPKAVNKVRLNK